MLELQDLKDFSIHNWYHMFEHIALKAILLEVPDVMLHKLRSDGTDFNLEETCSEDYVEKIVNAINTLDRSAFVKNNWHAPIDAKPFSFGNEVRITNLRDLALYLTASDILTQDFSKHSDIPFVIALKPWKSIHPASEFRCIVINGVLRGITPRDWPVFYAHFEADSHQIISKLKEFYEDNICGKFPRRHYVFDVVLTFPEELYLLDFGPLNSRTNLYAFSWKEVQPLLSKETREEVAPIFRYLETDIPIMTRRRAVKMFTKSLA